MPIAIYSSAVLIIVPSPEGNFPNVAQQAIACCVPVVGFDVCGMPNIIRHNVNGTLAVHLDAELLINEIERLLGDAEGA